MSGTWFDSANAQVLNDVTNCVRRASAPADVMSATNEQTKPIITV